MKKRYGRIKKVSSSIRNLYKAVFDDIPVKAEKYEKEIHRHYIKGLHIYAHYRVEAGSFVESESKANWHRIGTLAPRI